MSGRPGLRERLGDQTIQLIGLAVLVLVLVAVTWTVNPNFLGAYKLKTLSRDIAILAIFALGQALVIIAGGIDLSSGSVICFVGTVALHLASPAYGLGWSLAAVLAITLATSAAIGTVHGLLVCRLDLQPFMVTLCSLLLFRSVARGLTGDDTRSYAEVNLPDFYLLGNGAPLGVPLPVWVLGLVLAGLGVFLHLTVHGRYLFAIGHNLEAARYAGVRIHLLRVVTFALSAVLAGVAGLLEASTVQSVQPSSAGVAYELHGITAAVLGGCALRGGRGSLLGVVLGATVLKVLRDMIVFVGLGTHWADAVIGLVLLVAVVADALVRRRGAG